MAIFAAIIFFCCISAKLQFVANMSEPQLATMLSAAEIVKRADRRFFFLEQEMILKEIETISALGHTTKVVKAS